MKQACAEIAKRLSESMADADIGFSDFLYGECATVQKAIELHWIYMVEPHDKFKHSCAYQDAYIALMRLYNNRISKQINTAVYGKIVELLVERELLQVPLIQNAIRKRG